ncbi:MAG TPA: pilus assembly protein [Anaerolineaceae bacterium]|nr:pilus assembly protein [Anaerolineaceae bacterium]HPN51589.1 pilus assembly protein [Anaerolineaceae bacterium]
MMMPNLLKKLQSLKRGGARGQSFIEVAIFIPILLMMFTGVVEFGFLLNYYLNLVDGPREAARFAVDISPFVGASTNDNPPFYTAVAGEAITAIHPYTLNPARDDVIVSVFSIRVTGTDTVTIVRYPTAATLAGESALDNTPGEYHLYGHGGTCDPAADITCHRTMFTAADIEARLRQGTLPPSTGIILIELFYDYPQVLKLPWILAIVPDPIPVSTYTIMPLPAAEPN